MSSQTEMFLKLALASAVLAIGFCAAGGLAAKASMPRMAWWWRRLAILMLAATCLFGLACGLVALMSRG